jgi:hypothetical protein|tara:strand:- start:2920 stop:3417 length:498 start_codon:yes stop_codon:yes gene_type:complete
MNPFAILAVVAAVGKAYSTYQAGMSQKAYYDAQADQSRLRYKSEEIQAKEQGVEALEESNKILSTIIAKGASSGFLVSEGTNKLAQIITVRSGIEDFNTAALNQEVIQNLGIIEFGNLKAAGKQAAKAGIYKALFSLGTDIGTIGATGGLTPKQSPQTGDITGSG